MSFILFTLCMTVFFYPFFGAVCYGDPWTWVFKRTKE